MQNVHRSKLHSIWHTVRIEYILASFLCHFSNRATLENCKCTFKSILLEFEKWYSHQQSQWEDSYQLPWWQDTSWGRSRAPWTKVREAWRQPRHEGGAAYRAWRERSALTRPLWGKGHVNSIYSCRPRRRWDFNHEKTEHDLCSREFLSS